MAIALFPKPREVRFDRKRLDFSDAAWVCIDPALSDRAKGHAREFAEALDDAFPRPPQVTAGTPARGQVLLTIALQKRGIEPQGYELSAAPDGIRLTACDEAGVFYGLQTLRQIIAQTGPRMSAFEISDYPDFPRRGVMLDVSRCKVPTMETLLDLVDMLAALKINHIQLYVEHTFAFSEHEAVWHDASPFTAAEILELDAYCRDLHIELAPNLNSFGHFERWLRHPEYRHLSECPDGFTHASGRRFEFGTTLKPNRNSLNLLESLYAEYLPNFTSRNFNVGCDETWELGQGWSKDLCERKGGKTRVYLDFLKKIHKLVRKHQRVMMFWGDIILHEPELIPELPGNTVALEWGYEADHDFRGRCRRFAEAGVPFYVCPGTSSFDSLTGRTANALGNLSSAARNGLGYGAVGYLNTDWGDGGHHHYLPVSYLGFAAGAAYSWCLKANENADIADALNRWVFEDPSGRTGKLYVELGRVLELAQRRRRNCSIFYRLLFGPIGHQEHIKEIKAAELRKCIRRFDLLEADMAGARPDVPDAELVKAEFRNAAAMARHGARRGLAGLGGKNFDPAAMRHELQHIIAQHEALWLERNRPGGLRESSGHLRRLLADYG